MRPLYFAVFTSCAYLEGMHGCIQLIPGGGGYLLNVIGSCLKAVKGNLAFIICGSDLDSICGSAVRIQTEYRTGKIFVAVVFLYNLDFALLGGIGIGYLFFRS